MNIWLLICRGALNDHGVEIEKTLRPKLLSPLNLHSCDVALLSSHIKIQYFDSTDHHKMSFEMYERHF